MRFATLALGFVLGAIVFIGASIVIAWTGPTAAPPNGNVDAPINVGTGDQIKDAGLGVNNLAVFGNAILSGTSRYLNFGPAPGEAGYGIRDNAGVMQFKDSASNWSNFLPSSGVTSITFADGTTQTTAAGGITEQITVSCGPGVGVGTCPAACPTGYIRSGCSATNGDAYPSGSDACLANCGITRQNCQQYAQTTIYAHCIK